MTAKYYAICDYDTTDAFYISDDECVPRAFETEGDAVMVAKEYSCTTLILKTVARVTERTSHKVEKIK